MKKLLSVVLCAILILNCLLACVSCDMGELLEDPEETKVNKNENTQKNEQTADIATEIDTEENTDSQQMLKHRRWRNPIRELWSSLRIQLHQVNILQNTYLKMFRFVLTNMEIMRL